MKLKLRSKMSLSILSVVLLLFASVIFYIESAMSAKVESDAEALALESIRGIGKNIQLELEADYEALNTLVNIIEKMDRTRPDARETVAGMVASVTAMSARVSSVWLAFEPDAFDGRDAEFAGGEWYGKTGQFTLSFWDNRDGTAKRTKDVTPEDINLPGEGDYYQIPLRTGKENLLPTRRLTLADGSKVTATMYSIPIKLDGKTVGAIGMDLGDFAEVNNMLAKADIISNRASIYFFANDGAIVYARDPQLIGGNLLELTERAGSSPEIRKAVAESKEMYLYESLISGERALKIFSPVRIGKAERMMSLNVNIPEADIQSATRALTRNVVLASTGGLLVLAGIILWIVGRVVRPIAGLSGVLRRCAELDFTTKESDLWLLKYTDEIGDMIRAYVGLKKGVIDMLKSLKAEAEKFAETAQNLAAISQQSVASMEEVKASVDEVARLSSSNSSALSQANSGAEEVSQAATATATAAEQGAEAASRTTQLNQEAVSKVKEVVSKIRTVEEQSRVSGDSIEKVNASVEAIAGFVSTITGIADQTNLLALNAAIEAARAGEAGRGFAVVAEEVRKLAEESGNAAQKVEKLISELEADTGQASGVIQNMEAVLAETTAEAGNAQRSMEDGLGEVDSLNHNIQSIAAAAQQQAASSSEMASSVDRVTQATLTVVENLNGITMATDDTSSASQNVAEEAQRLSAGVGNLEKLLAAFQYDRVEMAHIAGGGALHSGKA